MKSDKEFIFIGKGAFFPDSGILAIGDLQIGYEEMLNNEGLKFPLNQLEKTKQDLTKIFNDIKNKNLVLKKIILLGDIKHHFSFNKKENLAINELLSFLESVVGTENLVLIKGNHDVVDLNNATYRDFYIEDNIAFIHGHKAFNEIFDIKTKIKTIVLAHLHPAVCIKDKQDIKREKYKCFLEGKFKRKTAIILPSFFPFVEGSCINEEKYDKYSDKDFVIIPREKLKQFNVYVPTENNDILDFGKLKKLF